MRNKQALAKKMRISYALDEASSWGIDGAVSVAERVGTLKEVILGESRLTLSDGIFRFDIRLDDYNPRQRVYIRDVIYPTLAKIARRNNNGMTWIRS